MSIGIIYRECATCADNVSRKVSERPNKNSVGSIAERSLNPGISREPGMLIIYDCLSNGKDEKLLFFHLEC